MDVSILENVQAFFRFFVGLALSILIVLTFIGAAWYGLRIRSNVSCRFVTWRLTLSKLPFFRELMMSSQGGKRVEG